MHQLNAGNVKDQQMYFNFIDVDGGNCITKR
jgi:hypothetical protein